MYTLRFPRWWLAGGYGLAILIVSLSLLPGLPAPSVSGLDKVGHVMMYAVLALWFCGIYRPSRWLLIVVLLVALGGLLELGQARTSHRVGGWPDMGANLSGTAIGLLLSWKFFAGWCVSVERFLGLQSADKDGDI